MPPILDAAWLDAHFNEVRICHVGAAMAGGDPYEQYLDAHIPGARYLSLDDDLAGVPGPGVGRHPLPAPDHFAAALHRVGISPDDTVVAYDARNGAFASRLVWMLRVLGRDAALLDGSMAAWPAERLEHGPVGVGPTVVDKALAAPWPDDALVDADVVAAHVAAGGVLVDSREAPRYRGEVEPIDAQAGHIPGAINLPFADNLADGRLRSVEELVERFGPLALDPPAIVYCGSGVTACHNALAAEMAGLPLPRVYVGSWSGWSTRS